MSLPIDFEKNPFVPTVVQDDESRDVLMVGFMNRLAFEQTLETGFVHFWSRSRNRLWKKGEISGHTQEVVSMAVNCEDNSLLIQVIQSGAVCHTGHRTCYYRQILPDGSLVETSDPVFDPAEVYQKVHTAEIAPADRKKRQQHDGTGIIAAWFGAYEFLGRQPLQEVSGTSKLLHDNVWPFNRVADELDELLGVLNGEHTHSDDLEQDVILEGSQVLYWLNVLAIGLGREWDRDLDLDNVFFPPPYVFDTTESEATQLALRKEVATWRDAEDGLVAEQSDFMQELFDLLTSSYRLVSTAVSPIVYPSRLIEHDLAELKGKSYLSAYFSSVDA